MEYRVLMDNSLQKIVEKVNQAIKDGWKPLGGVSADDGWFYQAITKENPASELPPSI